jgi:hypothetical protein
LSKPDAETISGIVTLAGTASSFFTLIALHLLPTGLSPLRNAVSQYGITRFRAGYRLQTMSMGVAAIAAAIGIREVGSAGGTLIVALLVVCGAARLAISWFPMDPPDSERTETGRRHGLLAIAAFATTAIAAIRLGEILDRAEVWRRVSGAVTGLGYGMAVALIALGASRRTESFRGYFGLVERAFYAGAIAFFAIVGVQLLQH